MHQLDEWMMAALRVPEGEAQLNRLKEAVTVYCRRFPVLGTSSACQLGASASRPSCRRPRPSASVASDWAKHSRR